jgi:hypothetical protein
MKLKVVIAGVFVGLAASACGTVGHAATQSAGAAPAAAHPASVSSASGVTGHGSSAAAAAQLATTSRQASQSKPVKPAVAPAPAVKVSAKPVVFDCLNRPVVEPSSYVLTCADNGSFLYHLKWTSWKGARATATGVHELNDCTPNCAEGTFHKYPAVITFWRPEPLAGHPGEKYFTRITVCYTGPRPPMYMSNGQLVKNPASWTGTLGS